jgi:hypothetical protein
MCSGTSLDSISYGEQCNPRCPEHQVFPRPAATVSQARWRDGNNFRGCATNRNPRGLRMAVATTTSRPPSSRTEVSAPEGARQIQQGPQPKELPRLPRVIDSMRHWSNVGSVGPLHGPGQQRSHASAGQPGRTKGEDQLGPTTSHLGQCSRRTFRRTRRTNQMCSTNSPRLRRRHHRLPGIHCRRHSDRRAAILRVSGPVSGPVVGLS